MDGSKSPFKSLGVMGPAIGTGIAAIAALFGADVTPEEGQLVVDQTAAAIGAISIALGTIAGIVGRWRATRRVVMGAK